MSGRLEQLLAWLLLANGGVLLAAAGATAVRAATLSWLGPSSWLAILAVFSGALLLRGSAAGRWGGLLCSALQAFVYYPYSGGKALGFQWGLSLAAVLQLSEGVLVVNLLALAMLLACAVLPILRRRLPVQTLAR
jgi:hypothetical protein